MMESIFHYFLTNKLSHLKLKNDWLSFSLSFTNCMQCSSFLGKKAELHWKWCDEMVLSFWFVWNKQQKKLRKRSHQQKFKLKTYNALPHFYILGKLKTNFCSYSLTRHQITHAKSIHASFITLLCSLIHISNHAFINLLLNVLYSIYPQIFI